MDMSLLYTISELHLKKLHVILSLKTYILILKLIIYTLFLLLIREEIV